MRDARAPLRVAANRGLFVVIAFAFVAGPLAAQEIDFAHDIVPILKARCAECHTNGKRKGDVALDTREAPSLRLAQPSRGGLSRCFLAHHDLLSVANSPTPAWSPGGSGRSSDCHWQHEVWLTGRTGLPQCQQARLLASTSFRC